MCIACIWSVNLSYLGKHRKPQHSSKKKLICKKRKDLSLLGFTSILDTPMIFLIHPLLLSLVLHQYVCVLIFGMRIWCFCLYVKHWYVRLLNFWFAKWQFINNIKVCVKRKNNIKVHTIVFKKRFVISNYIRWSYFDLYKMIIIHIYVHCKIIELWIFNCFHGKYVQII